MIDQPVRPLDERPAGDPVQLRKYAHQLGAMGEQVFQVMRPYPTAMQTASMHMPIRRLPHFSLIGRTALERQRRLRDSLGQMSVSLLHYARALERAQDAVDAANHRNVPEHSPVQNAMTPILDPVGRLDDPVAHNHMVRVPTSLPGGTDTGYELAETALRELRLAKQRCMRTMGDVVRDWPSLFRTGPIRLPITTPIGLPPRWTGPVRLPVLPVWRHDPVQSPSPVQTAGLGRAQVGGSADVVDGRVQASRYPGTPISTGALAHSLPA